MKKKMKIIRTVGTIPYRVEEGTKLGVVLVNEILYR
jgi:hypothetical protein